MDTSPAVVTAPHWVSEDLGGRSPTADEISNCQKHFLEQLPIPNLEGFFFFFPAFVEGGESLQTSPSPRSSHKPLGTEMTMR